MTVWIVFCLLLILYAALCAYMFHMVFAGRPNRRLMPKPKDPEALSPWDQFDDAIQEGLAWFRAQPCREVFLTARDATRLRGRYLPYPGSDKAILLVHGYRSTAPENDFACALRLYYARGFNILLIDQRAQGHSGGKIITFGVLERLDVADWAKYLDETYHPRAIVLDGMSMGAATVLMALALPLPKSVVGAIADCGFTAPEAIISYVMRDDFNLPVRLFLPGLRALFRLRTGHSLREASAPKALAGSALPVLLIHGEDDRYVPCAMGRENARAARDATLVTVPGAGHGVSFLTDPEKCVEALDKFLNRVIQ